MGLLKRPATEDELLSYEGLREKSADGRPARTAGADDDDPLRAARGTVLGVLLGGLIWAVVLWVLL